MDYLLIGVWLVVGIILFTVFVFILWRKFRLDYGEREIMTFGILGGLAFVALGLGFRIWAGLLGMMTVLFLFVKKHRWDGWEIWDTIMPILGLFLGVWYWPFGFSGLLGLWVYGNFRKFGWYKSGRPGLAGLMTFGSLCLILVAKNLGADDKLNVAGITADQIAGIWLLTGVLVSIYLRSRLKLLK